MGLGAPLNVHCGDLLPVQVIITSTGHHSTTHLQNIVKNKWKPQYKTFLNLKHNYYNQPTILTQYLKEGSTPILERERE